MVIVDLTQSGVVDPGRLYEAPYTRLSANRHRWNFSREAEIVQLFQLLEDVRLRAVA